MKKTFKSTIVLAMILGVFAIAAYAQPEPMAGGYGDMSVRSKAAKDAAAIAVRQYSARHPRDKVTLVRIRKAAQQVVAGMNYRLCMVVKNKRGIRRAVTTIVYQPIRKAKRMTNWTGGCSDL